MMLQLFPMMCEQMYNRGNKYFVQLILFFFFFKFRNSVLTFFKNLPIINLKYCKSRILRQLLFLILRRVWMLKQKNL